MAIQITNNTPENGGTVHQQNDGSIKVVVTIDEDGIGLMGWIQPSDHIGQQIQDTEVDDAGGHLATGPFTANTPYTLVFPRSIATWHYDLTVWASNAGGTGSSTINFQVLAAVRGT
jgi:hypothetical protein